MSNLNAVDFVILIIFFFSILAGFGRGFVREVISLGTLIAAVIVASMFANSLAMAVTGSSAVQSAITQASTSMGMNAAQPVSYLALGGSFLALFVGTMLAGALVGYFLNMAFQVGMLGIGNRLFGAIFGLGRGFVINLVLIFLVQLSPMAKEPWWLQSQLVDEFQPAVTWMDNLVAPGLATLKARVGQELENATKKMQEMSPSMPSYNQ